MYQIDENTEECNPNKKYKLLIVFDNMTAEMFSNNQPNLTVTQLFLRGRKLNIFLVFITKSTAQKDIRLSSVHRFFMETPIKENFSHFQNFMNLYKKCTVRPYSFLFIDAAVASDNPLRIRKNLSEKSLKIIMTIDDKIRDQKLRYNTNRKTAKISMLLSGKSDK